MVLAKGISRFQSAKVDFGKKNCVYFVVKGASTESTPDANKKKHAERQKLFHQNCKQITF